MFGDLFLLLWMLFLFSIESSSNTRQVDVVLCLSLINAVFVNSIALLLLLILPIALVAWQLEIGSINLVLRDFPAITH